MFDFTAGHAPFLFFLKAVQKKQIYIPAFVRADGTAVAGHMKWVHVADDHDDHKVAHGQGTHSQKIAHGKLAKHDWYHALPTEHKAAVVMAHATDHQTLESAGSRVSKMRDKILKGVPPSAGEWRAWGYIDADRRQKEYDAITAAGMGAFFQQHMNAEEVAKGVEDRKERLEHQSGSTDAEQPKEAPAQPEPAPEPKPEPEPEPESKAVPKTAQDSMGAATAANSGKLGLHIVKHPSGTFGYAGTVPDAIGYEDGATPEKIAQGKQFGQAFGPKSKKFATAAEAVAYAKQHGFDATPPKAEEKPASAVPAPAPHAAGDKAAEHQAVLDAIDSKMLPADAVNAYANVKYKLVKQMFEAGDVKGLLNLTYGTNPYGKFAAKLANMALKVLGSEHQVAPGQKSGTHPALAGDVTPKQSAAAQPAKEEPKDEPKPEAPAAEPQPATPAQPEGAAPAAAAEALTPEAAPAATGALAMPQFEEGKEVAGVAAYYEKQAQKILDMAAAGDAAGLEKMKADGLQPNSKGKVGNTFKGKTANSKILLALHDAALAQAKGGAGAAPAAPAAADNGPKEGDTKPAADGGTLVLKDGHWIKQDEPQAAGDASLALSDAEMPDFPDVPALQMLKLSKAAKAADKGDLDGVKAAMAELGHTEGKAHGYIQALIDKMEAKAGGPAKPASLADEVQAAGFTVVHFGGQVCLAKGGFVQGFANKTQAENAVNKLADAGFKALVGPKHPFKVVITGKVSAPAAVEIPAPPALKDFNNQQLAMVWNGMAKDALTDPAQKKKLMGSFAAFSDSLQSGKLNPHDKDMTALGMHAMKLAKLLGMNLDEMDAPAAAPAGPIGLTEAEIGPKPLGVSSTVFKDAVKYAQAGDIGLLQSLQKNAEDNGWPNSAAHVAGMIDALKAKQGVQGAAPAPAEPAGPVAPVAPDGATGIQSAINIVTQHLKNKDVQSLVDVQPVLKQMTEANSAYAPVLQYAKDAAAHLGAPPVDADTPAPAPAPEKPKSPVPPEFANNFEVKNFILTMKLAPKHVASLGTDPGEWIAPEDVAGYEALSSADKVKVHEAIAAIGPQQAELLGKWLEWHDKKDGSQKLNAWLENTGSASEAMALAKQHVAFEGKTPEAYNDAIASLKKYGFSHAAETLLFDKMNAHLDKPPAKPLPAKPFLVATGNVQLADQMEQLAIAGDLAGIQKMQASSEVQEISKLSTYAHNLAQHLIDNGIAPNPAAAADDDSPKDGDTKQGADGMLVFQNGRWHKQGTDPKVLKKLAASVPLPKMTGTNAIKYGGIAKHLKAVAEVSGAKGLAKVMKPTPGGKLALHGDKKIQNLYPNDTSNSPNGNLLMKYALALQAAMAGTQGGAPVAAKVVGATENAPPAPKFPAGSPNEKMSIAGWTKTAGQKGFNEGGFYTSPDGQEWYCKFPAGGEAVAKNELLANRLAALAGLNVPDLQLVTQGGKVGLASKIIAGAKEDKAGLLAGKAKGLLESFGAHAWLANWDAVGNNPSKGFDNILIDDKGVAHHIDQGGALTYGGAGGAKIQFGEKVIELKTMLDASKNANTAAVFGKMGATDIAASVAKVLTISDEQINSFVSMHGPGDAAEKAALAAKLIARKNDMAAQYPQAVEIAKKMSKKAGAPATPEKPKLDPENLPVTIDKLPKPHDFMNWQNSGKPISDKPYVAFNMKAEADIIAAAMKGNLVALQNYHYMAVEQTTGKELGLKPIAEHPSKHVKEFWESCVNHLDAIANPPEALKEWDGVLSDNIKELSDAFPAKLFGASASKVAANEKLGFWIALGVAKDVSKFAPKSTKHAHLLTGIKDKGKALYQNYKTVVKQFISAVQGSGSANQPYRDGKEIDTNGNSTREVLRELYKCAQHKPEGTTLTKWIDFYPGMIDQFEANPEGLIFQNPGSMCCSMHPTATKDKGFGHHRVTIRFAEGAAACDTFGSGGFASEMEITTLPGARFMVLNKGWGVDGDKSRYNLEVLLLPPDQTYVDAI